MVVEEQFITDFLNFRNNIRCYRKALHLTQEELAEKADLSTSYIKQIESEMEFRNITLLSILKLAQALEVSIASLFIEKDETN